MYYFKMDDVMLFLDCMSENVINIVYSRITDLRFQIFFVVFIFNILCIQWGHKLGLSNQIKTEQAFSRLQSLWVILQLMEPKIMLFFKRWKGNNSTDSLCFVCLHSPLISWWANWRSATLSSSAHLWIIVLLSLTVFIWQTCHFWGPYPAG